jgi:putative ABC transport system permease protein
VTGSPTLVEREFRFPAGVQAELEAVPGIGEVQPVRTPRMQFRGKPVMIVAVEMAITGRHIRRMVVAGDQRSMDRLVSEGKGVVLSETLAQMQKIGLGDAIELATPAGPLRMPVVGVIRDYSNQLGSIYLERSVYVRAFQDDTVNIFRVYVKPGASAGEVRRRIIDQVGNRRRLFVLSNREVRDYLMGLTDQWFGLTYIQVIVAVVVAILGIVNTLTVSIADRRRELGVLRAVGGLRAQIRGTVWMEAVAIGLIGLTLGVGIGAVNLYYELQALKYDLAGMSLSYEFPWGVMAMLAPVILAAAFASALFPAESAVRGSLVEALEYE